MRFIQRQRLQKGRCDHDLINDELQADMYKKDIEPNLKDGAMLMFAHALISTLVALSRLRM